MQFVLSFQTAPILRMENNWMRRYNIPWGSCIYKDTFLKLKVLNFLYPRLWAWKCSLCQRKSCRILDFLFPYVTTSSRALQVHELDDCNIKSCCKMGKLKMGVHSDGGQRSVKGIPNTSAGGKKGRAVRRVYGKAVRSTCTTGMGKGSLGFSQLWKCVRPLRAQILGFGTRRWRG